jgi:hypothetical protein
VLASGAGAEARNSIGLVLVGGMTIGTTFTLLVIPSVYMLVARQHGSQAVFATDQQGTGCPIPDIEGLELPPGCQLAADADCQLSLECNKTKAKVMFLKAS